MNIEEERKKIISSLTAARLEKNLSQEALARLVGTKRSNISRMESGAQNISLDSFLKIASALGKEVHLFTFRRHPSINLPEARLQAIEEQISFRVKELLSLPRK